MSLEQQVGAHHAQGMVTLHMANYLQNPANKAYAESIGDEHTAWEKSSRFYQEAAHEFFFAAELDVVTGGPSKKLWQDISDKLSDNRKPNPEITVVEIPGYGTWRGDGRWLKQPFMNFHMNFPCPPAKLCSRSRKELQALKDGLEIEWRDDNVGMLRLMAPQ